MNLLSHRNVHRITCHPVAAENQHCREFLHLLPVQERTHSSPGIPQTHSRWAPEPVSGPGFRRSQREASRNRRPLHSALRSRPHTSATREPGSAIFTGRQKRGAPRRMVGPAVQRNNQLWPSTRPLYIHPSP
jgi:hypothetical protein